MKDIELFQIALGISSPWFVKSLELDPVAKRLDIHLDFQKGSKEALNKAGRMCKFFWCVEIGR